MKALALIGAAPNQVALASKLHDVHQLVEIVCVNLPPSKNKAWLGLFNNTIGLPLKNAWVKLHKEYSEAFEAPAVPVNVTESANSALVLEKIKNIRPDLVLVSGTDLLRKEVINEVEKHGRILNLHTGLSPYMNGGPNCTNWALATKRFSYIGNTIMWLNAGIDSGDIVVSERTPLTGNESISELHKKVMEHAHSLYCKAYSAFVEGKSLPSVPQASIGPGCLFLTKHWQPLEVVKALINFKLFYRRSFKRKSCTITVVSVIEGKNIVH
jgi:folate-dependent phosphoribosylglycinamide formyltransferase PurN